MKEISLVVVFFSCYVCTICIGYVTHCYSYSLYLWHITANTQAEKNSASIPLKNNNDFNMI